MRKIMRKIEMNGLPDFVEVMAEINTKNPGGAPNYYTINGTADGKQIVEFSYQNGVIVKDDDGNLLPNGILDECLMVILIDRLTHFQEGEFANEYTAKALVHVCGANAICVSQPNTVYNINSVINTMALIANEFDTQYGSCLHTCNFCCFFFHTMDVL